MEVHHHAHSEHGKKNWKSYFWEFLMLFLAVFCGFLAENQREVMIEHHREKEFMKLLVEDLKADVNQIDTYVGWRHETNQDFDSLIFLFSNKELNTNIYLIYKLCNRSALRFGLPDLSERTIQQLKNSGGLRLIRNQAVSNAINKHYMEANRMKSYFETERLERMTLVNTRADVLDAIFLSKIKDSTVDPNLYKLITSDPIKINHFLNSILTSRQINTSLLTQLDQIKTSTLNLKELIQEKYNLE